MYRFGMLRKHMKNEFIPDSNWNYCFIVLNYITGLDFTKLAIKL